MMAVPADTPVTRPEFRSMVATDVALLVQVPPRLVLLSETEEPAQTAAGPLIVPALSPGFTVTLADAVDTPHAVLTV
jgi:hypothetical protein